MDFSMHGYHDTWWTFHATFQILIELFEILVLCFDTKFSNHNSGMKGLGTTFIAIFNFQLLSLKKITIHEITDQKLNPVILFSSNWFL